MIEKFIWWTRNINRIDIDSSLYVYLYVCSIAVCHQCFCCCVDKCDDEKSKYGCKIDSPLCKCTKSMGSCEKCSRIVLELITKKKGKILSWIN